MKKRVLIAEDDATLRAGLERSLAFHGYVVVSVENGPEALARLRDGGLAAAILDIGLPLCDGLEVLRTARADGISIPVLLLTARDQPNDRVLGLDSGADDYLVKPFHLTELLARLRALLRRSADTIGQLNAGRLSLDTEARCLVGSDGPVPLTPSEFELLALFLRRAGKVLSREQLETVLTAQARTVGSNTLDVHIHRLRRKLGPTCIHTVHGVGYRFDPADEGGVT